MRAAMCQTRRARINLIHPNALTWNLWLSRNRVSTAGETKDTPAHWWVPHTYSHVPTSSSIIRRHGRVRFTVVISTGDRMLLSHFFLPVNRAPRPPPPPTRLRSFLPRATPTATPANFRLRWLPVGSLGPCSLAALTSGWSGQNGVVMETRSRATPLDTPLTTWPTLYPLLPRAPVDKGVHHLARRISKATQTRRVGGGRSRYGGKPHGPCSVYIVKGPSTLRVPLILPQYARYLWRVSVCGREHMRAAILAMWSSLWSTPDCMRAQDIGLDPRDMFRGDAEKRDLEARDFQRR